MNLDDLSTVPNSKTLNHMIHKIFGYSVNLENLDLGKAKSLKESFDAKLNTYVNKNGARATVSDATYLQLKLVSEALDKHISEAVDLSDEAHELVLFGENDGDLYRQRTVPIQKNLSKKFAKGVYDPELAQKLWMYWATDAAKRYAQQHSTGNDWNRIFSVAVRKEVAQYMEEYWREELEAGNAMESVETDEESVIVEGEMEEAQAVMAAKSIVDRLQGMLEDLGEVLNEDLPPLTDNIRDQMDSTAAETYSAAVSAAVSSALEAMRGARESAENAARGLTGEAEVETIGVEEPDMEPTTDMDMDQPADDLDSFGAADSAQGGDAEVGRETRD